MSGNTFKSSHRNLQDISIRRAKTDLSYVLRNINLLEQKEFELKVGLSIFSKEKWESKLEELQTLHNLSSSILQLYKNKITTAKYHSLLDRRKKKRARIQRRKQNSQAKRRRSVECRNYKHAMIDKCLEIKQLKDLKARQLKEAADYATVVLSNITKKKSAAKRYIHLLNSLVELRKTRRISSQNSDDNRNTNFQHKTNRLIAVWKDAFEEFEKEEARLKFILSNTHKSIEDQWKEVLFGHTINVNLAPTSDENSFAKLLETRQGWDSCIVPQNFECGSYIPTGLIIPSKCPLDKWSMYRN